MYWDVRADAWAGQEELEVGRYDAALQRLKVEPGESVLDVGCGSGVFLARAAAAGAAVAGLDAAAGLVAVARRRLPGADLRKGDLERLPFEEDRFGVVTWFNSLFFARDLVAALREGARVTRPGGRALVQVWGDPERCDLKRAIAAVGALAGGGPPPSELWRDGALEELARRAGLTPLEVFDVRVPLDYPDDATMLACVLSPPPMVATMDAAGEEAVKGAVLRALAPMRGADGGYALHNEWHYLIARVSG